MLHTQARDELLFSDQDMATQGFGPKYGHGKEENCRLSSFPKCVAGMQPDPGITVNCCGHAAIEPRRAEVAGLRACFSTRTIALRATHRLSVSPFMPVGLFGEGFPHPGADQDCVILGERFGRHGVPSPRDRSPRSFLRSPAPSLLRLPFDLFEVPTRRQSSQLGHLSGSCTGSVRRTSGHAA
jgi:hypothetical protein